MRRVVITGMGAVTPLGNDLPTTWRRLLAGESGVDTIKAFDPSPFPVQIAAEVKDDYDPSGVVARPTTPISAGPMTAANLPSML